MKYFDDVIGTGKLQNRDKRTKFSLMTKFYQFWSDFKMRMVSLTLIDKHQKLRYEF